MRGIDAKRLQRNVRGRRTIAHRTQHSDIRRSRIGVCLEPLLPHPPLISTEKDVCGVSAEYATHHWWPGQHTLYYEQLPMAVRRRAASCCEARCSRDSCATSLVQGDGWPVHISSLHKLRIARTEAVYTMDSGKNAAVMCILIEYTTS